MGETGGSACCRLTCSLRLHDLVIAKELLNDNDYKMQEFTAPDYTKYHSILHMEQPFSPFCDLYKVWRAVFITVFPQKVELTVGKSWERVQGDNV